MSFVRIHIVLVFLAVAMNTSFTTAFAAPSYDEAGCLDNNVAFVSGLGCWVYHDNGQNFDKPVRVHYYYPPNYSSGSKKVIFAMHSSSRDTSEVIERWRSHADIYGALIIAPEFNKDHYPMERHYGRGNVRDNNGDIRDRNDWTYMTIEEIFDLVRQEIPNTPNNYSIEGHSAGGQFVHRLVLMLPDARIETAVPVNPGWYLHPDEYDDYPCGISDIETLDIDLSKSYAKNLVLMLGTDDNDPNFPGLNHGACAEAQGSNRYDRGHYFYTYIEDDAVSRDHIFNWTVVDVPGVGHNADQMLESGVQAIFAETPPPSGYVLSPTQDAIVKASYPNSNYGARNELQVDGRSVKTTYMQFDLQAIQDLNRAVLRLRITDPSDGVQYVNEVVNNNWNENTLTYNNRPSTTTNITSFNGGELGSWVSIDITDHVIAMKGQTMSIAIESPDSDGLYFNSKEASEYPPELIIFDAIAPPIPPPSVQVQSPTQDATVKASYPNSNYGARDKLQVDGNSVKTTYMQFDLQALQSLSSAILRLKITDQSKGIQYVKEVASSNWNENTLTYSNRPIATTTITSFNGGGLGDWVSIDITDYVLAMKGQVMSIAIESPDSDGLYFNSKESSVNPPELVIYD